jgi:hypothetical protein
VHEKLSLVHDRVLLLRDIRRQAEHWADRVEAHAVKDAAKALAETLTSIEDQLVQVKSEDTRMFPSKLNSRLAMLLPLMEYSDSASTMAQRELYQSLVTRIDMELARFDRCLREALPAFNALCRTSGVEAVIPKPAPAGGHRHDRAPIGIAAECAPARNRPADAMDADRPR